MITIFFILFSVAVARTRFFVEGSGKFYYLNRQPASSSYRLARNVFSWRENDQECHSIVIANFILALLQKTQDVEDIQCRLCRLGTAIMNGPFDEATGREELK